MDKNKALHKLQNFGPVYYINLDDQPERKEFMENQFEYWGIKNYTRISAYDGRNDDLSDIIKGKYPENVSTSEMGCLTSHLKAINHWYNTSDSPYAIFMEDDCLLDTVKYWDFTWNQFIARAPFGWDVLQLAVICTGDITVPIHHRFINEFSTACYVITRHHAQKIIKNHVVGDKYRLDQNIKPRMVCDDLVYNTGVTYSCPLFLYKIDLGSSIHPEHIDLFHRQCYEGIFNFWKNAGAQLSLDQITTLNPYHGRVSESSANKQ